MKDMKKLFALFMVLLMITACNHSTTSSNDSLVEYAKETIEEYIMNSLIDKREARIENVEVEFETPDIVVLHCYVTAMNQFGGMTRNGFEYICTKDGVKRLDNSSHGNTPYYYAKLMVRDSIHSKNYDKILENELFEQIRLW